MDQNPMSYSAREQSATYDEGLRSYMLGIYNYMCSALALTGITAWLGAHWQPLMDMLYTMHNGHMGLSGFGMIVMIAPLFLVMGLSFGVNRMSVSTAQMLFWAYAALFGLSLSSIFFAYTQSSIVRVFFITSIMFGGMSMWGYSTKRDLTGFGHFLFMGLLGIVIASLVNIFIGSSALYFVTSILGVVIFTGLIAWDTQKLKTIYYQAGPDYAARTSIMGALSLYLDFVNLFILMLRFFGDRRN